MPDTYSYWLNSHYTKQGWEKSLADGVMKIMLKNTPHDDERGSSKVLAYTQVEGRIYAWCVWDRNN